MTGAIQTCTRVVIAVVVVHRPPTKMTLTARSIDGQSETVEAEWEESWEAALRAQEDPPPSPHSFKRTPESEPTAQHLYTGGRSRALPKLLNHNTRHFCCFCRAFYVQFISLITQWYVEQLIMWYFYYFIFRGSHPSIFFLRLCCTPEHGVTPRTSG